MCFISKSLTPPFKPIITNLMKLFEKSLRLRQYFSSTFPQNRSKKQSVLLTGLQPTGTLHLGNYFGSVLNVLRYQQDPEFNKRFVFIADLHSLTTAFTSEHDSIVYNGNIGKDSFQMVRTLLACGVDPSKTTLFIQSHIPEHSELSWMLSCFANQHALNFMVQYKQKGNQYSSVGLYTYPLLMASDILIYKSTHVPVGIDQVQHLQLTNKIRQRFNKIVKQAYFPHVKYVQARKAKIMSLTNPEKKMSKSDTNQRSRINLTDSLKQVQQKLRRAVTDSQGHSITYEPQTRKGLTNLIDIYSILKSITPEETVQLARQNRWGIGEFKSETIHQVWKVLEQIQGRSKQLSDDAVKRIINQGAQKARFQASRNINDIKKLLKLA